MSVSIELLPVNVTNDIISSLKHFWGEDEISDIRFPNEISNNVELSHLISQESTLVVSKAGQEEVKVHVAFFQIDSELDDLETFLGYNTRGLDDEVLIPKLEKTIEVGFTIDLELTSPNIISREQFKLFFERCSHLSRSINVLLVNKDHFEGMEQGLYIF